MRVKMPRARPGSQLARVRANNRNLPRTTARDMRELDARLKDFVKLVKEEATDLQTSLVVDCYINLQASTPIGNPLLWKNPRPRPGYVPGTAFNSWEFLINGVVARHLAAAVPRIRLGDKLGIRSTAPYMEALNRGHSKQAPPGWIDMVIDRVLRNYR